VIRPIFQRVRGLLLVVSVTAAGLVSVACVTRVLGEFAGLDTSTITIQTASLFNQKVPSRIGTRNWNGDWIFRRDRLVAFDRALRNIKPDILLLQEVLAKRGAFAEVDRNILMSGALEDFGWTDRVAQEFDDMQEVQTMAVVTAPSVPVLAKPNPEVRDFWLIGNDGFLMATIVEIDDQPVVVFNVQMPQQLGQKYLWYTFLEERIAEWLKIAKTCNKRVIVGGYLPGDQDSKRFNDMMVRIGLRDSSAGFCEVASNCHTATPLNEMFLATVGDETPSQPDRVLVPQSASVLASGRNLLENEAENRWTKDFGLTRMWPTQRFGWRAAVRLARCTRSDLATELENIPASRGTHGVASATPSSSTQSRR